MNKKELLIEKYHLMVDLLYMGHMLKHGTEEGFNIVESIKNPEIIAGYYLWTYDNNSLRIWQKNTKHKTLNKNDKEVDNILKELSEPKAVCVDIEEVFDGNKSVELLVWVDIEYENKLLNYHYCTPILKEDVIEERLNNINLLPFIYDMTDVNISGVRYKKEIELVSNTIRKFLTKNIYDILVYKYNGIENKDIIKVKTSEMDFTYRIQQH